jgi:hypothetical protein
MRSSCSRTWVSGSLWVCDAAAPPIGFTAAGRALIRPCSTGLPGGMGLAGVQSVASASSAPASSVGTGPHGMTATRNVASPGNTSWRLGPRMVYKHRVWLICRRRRPVVKVRRASGAGETKRSHCRGAEAAQQHPGMPGLGSRGAGGRPAALAIALTLWVYV